MIFDNTYIQIINLLIFIVVGIVLGIIFDSFRIIRKSFKTPDFVTYIEDILFWIISGIILLFCIFTFNNGELRLYLFASIIVGNIIYMVTLSKYFIKVSTFILISIKKILFIPFSLVKKFLIIPTARPIQNVNKYMTKLFKKLFKKIQNPNIRKKI